MFLRILFGLLSVFALLAFSSCGDAPNPDPNNPTTTQQDELEEWADDHDIDINDLKKKFFVERNGVNIQNRTTNLTFYYFFDDSTMKNHFDRIIPRLNQYFNDKDVGFKVTFTLADRPAQIIYNTSYNTVSDKNLSQLGLSVKSDAAGRYYSKVDSSQTIIQTTQIEIIKTKNALNYPNKDGELQGVLLHELGHAMGLDDITDSDYQDETVMWHDTTYLANRSDSEYYYILDTLLFKELYK